MSSLSLFISGEKLENCSCITHHECENGKIITITGICGVNGCEEKIVDEKPCDTCRTVEVWSRKDAVCLKSPDNNVIVLECGKDKEEEKCCCYIQNHTYSLENPVRAEQIWVKFKPGWGIGCQADVRAVVYGDNGGALDIYANNPMGNVVGYMNAELNGMCVSEVQVVESVGCF